VKLLVLVDVAVVLAALCLWFVLRDDPRENVANEGLRGSVPPAGRSWPDLAEVDGIAPSFPTIEDVRGTATMLVATCADCRSGDIIGGFLGRLAEDELPEDARVVVLTWEGDQRNWATRWRVDGERFELHAAAPGAATDRVRLELGIGKVGDAEESGIAFLHDGRGRWRSSFFVGQLVADDVAHDLRELDPD
jgi:hypothetical protein